MIIFSIILRFSQSIIQSTDQLFTLIKPLSQCVAMKAA